MKTHKLVPELVPRPLWGISAPRALNKSTAWKAIRKDTIAEAGNRCLFCSTDTRLECHDKWKYDDKNCVATLVGFEIRCKMCHMATHIGRARKLGFLAEAVMHICSVNGCTPDDVRKIVDAEMPRWERRSKKRWTVVVAPTLLKRYPSLQAVPLMTSSEVPEDERQ
jgi:hypothetical protein